MPKQKLSYSHGHLRTPPKPAVKGFPSHRKCQVEWSVNAPTRRKRLYTGMAKLFRLPGQLPGNFDFDDSPDPAGERGSVFEFFK